MNIPEKGREKVGVRRLCFYRELTAGASLFSLAYVAALAVARLVSIFTRALSTGTGAVLGWGEGRGGEGKLHVKHLLSITGNQHYVLTFTSQMVQMLHKEPGRNADSSSPENILHFRK